MMNWIFLFTLVHLCENNTRHHLSGIGFSNIYEHTFEVFLEKTKFQTVFVEINDFGIELPGKIREVDVIKLKNTDVLNLAKKNKKIKYDIFKITPLQEINKEFYIKIIQYGVSYKAGLIYELVGNTKVYYKYDCEHHIWIFLRIENNYV